MTRHGHARPSALEARQTRELGRHAHKLRSRAQTRSQSAGSRCVVSYVHTYGKTRAMSPTGRRKSSPAAENASGDIRERWPRREPSAAAPGLPSTSPPYSESMIRSTVPGVSVVVFLVGCGGSGHALRLPRDPYVGLRCYKPNALRCGRVGLAVWVAQPARNVTAIVDRHYVVLGTRAGGTGAYPRGLFWEGIFADPSAQRIADASGSVSVRLRVTENDGSVGNANSTVRVSEGYG